MKCIQVIILILIVCGGSVQAFAENDAEASVQLKAKIAETDFTDVKSVFNLIDWSVENKIQPRSVFKSSACKFKFNCDCGHSFVSLLANITSSGQWCPFCSHTKLCKKNCEICFEKSFASLGAADASASKRDLGVHDPGNRSFPCCSAGAAGPGRGSSFRCRFRRQPPPFRLLAPRNSHHRRP